MGIESVIRTLIAGGCAERMGPQVGGGCIHTIDFVVDAGPDRWIRTVVGGGWGEHIVEVERSLARRNR